MNKKNQRFRINHNILKTSNANKEVSTIGLFLTKAIQAIKQRASATYTKLQSKLIQTPSVVIVPHKENKQRQVMITDIIPKEKDYSLNKHSQSDKQRSKSTLSNTDQLKIRHLLNRKQELMQKLRKIDYDLMNPSIFPITRQENESRISYQSPLKQMQSRMKIHQDQTYNALQHEKTIEMLARINNQKIRRQERIVSDMKKKQEKQIKRLVQIQNKSSMQLNKQSKITMAKFNSRQTDNLSYDRKTNTIITQSNHKAFDKVSVQNQFDALPQLITRQEQLNLPSLVTKGQQVAIIDENDPLDPRNL